MLTASQCEVVALVADGGIVCLDCARNQYGEMGVAAIEEGIAEFVPQDVSPLIRYELDSYIGSNAAEYADEESGGWAVDSEAWDKAYEDYPSEYPCDSCGKDIS